MATTPSAGEEENKQVSVLPEATFECVRCHTRYSGEELARLPELTCGSCGYRIFRKVRGPVAKTLKAE
ncbi:MAG TPA: hypothetical protein VLX56_07510 [Nitrososphaerales archaeon]|nr:hypothetical protein [Nitrososphaerales archaeon]